MRALVALAGIVGIILCLRLDLSPKRQVALATASGFAILLAARRRESARPVEDYHYLA